LATLKKEESVNRRFPINALLCLFMAASAVEGAAQTPYSVKPVRLVVPTAAGGGADFIARLITPKLSERLGQQVIIDNRPGAGSIIGSEVVAKAPADGYTLLLGFIALATNPMMYKKVPYDVQRDFSPITLAVSSPHVLVVHPSLPVHSVKELIALARRRPGELNYASAGIGTGPHLAMELFMSMAKVKIVHIQYKGSAPAVTDVVAGHVPIMAASILTGIPHVRSGRMRALGVTSLKRTSAAPNIPSIAEAGVPGYEMTQWYGILAPERTPRDIVARLQGDFSHVLQLPDVKERLVANGADPVGSTSEEFEKFIQSQTDMWAKVGREAGIKPE
jgi:tripartite-type tricarboxylate transporter receptor subunit TctC